MDGIVVVNKPRGLTSFDVVRKIKRLFKIRKAGHSGTLDPLATGVLPIFLGRATKAIKYFINGDKGYQGEMTLGITTDTYDADGKIINKTPVPIEHFPALKSKIEEVFKSFKGEIEQLPPMVSAVHYKGRRLYELARKGIEVMRSKRKVKIYKLEIKSITEGEHPKINFEVLCSKGTYIRSLVHEIGEKLGCGAHQSSLERVYSHPFTIKQALPLELIEDLAKIGKLSAILISMDSAFV